MLRESDTAPRGTTHPAETTHPAVWGLAASPVEVLPRATCVKTIGWRGVWHEREHNLAAAHKHSTSAIRTRIRTDLLQDLLAILVVDLLLVLVRQHLPREPTPFGRGARQYACPIPWRHYAEDGPAALGLVWLCL